MFSGCLQMCTSCRGQRFSVTTHIQKPQQSPLPFLKPKPCVSRRQQAASLSQQPQAGPLIPLPRGKESWRQKVPSLHNYPQNIQPWGHSHTSGAWASHGLLEPFLCSLPTLGLDDVVSVSPLWMIYSCFVFKIYFPFIDADHFLSLYWNLLQYCFCFMFWFFGHEACGILSSRPGIKPATPALESKISTTGPPGKSLNDVLLKFFFFKIFGCPGSLLLHLGFL